MSARIDECPGEDALLDLVSGRSSAREAEPLRAHIDDCDSCRTVVARLVVLVPTEECAEGSDAGGAEIPFRAAGLLRGRMFADRYRIERIVGHGGMGAVYAAWDVKLERRVALKLIRPGASSSPGELAARLVRESKAMARLRHPNVVTVYDVGTASARPEDGLPDTEQVYVAMEFVDGNTLRQWLVAAPRSWREVLSKFAAAGRGLAAAHSEGLVHRDFKPDNVLVDSGGRTLVTDFGLAREGAGPDQSNVLPVPSTERVASGAQDGLTETGIAVGTPAYMAPEQYRGEPTDVRADVFSFCAALFEGLYGQRPFGGKGAVAIQAAIQRGQLESTPSGRDVPRWLHRALVSGLAADPSARPRSMTAVLRSLRPPSRRAVAVVGSIAAAVTAAALLWGVGGRPPRPALCGEDAPMSATWGPDRAAAIGLALADQPSAATWPHVRKSLDDYAARWSEAHHRVCDRRSGSGAELAAACLAVGRAGFAAVVRVLGDGYASGLDAVDGLQAVDDCASNPKLRAIMPMPADRELGTEVDAVREELVAVETTLEAGRLDRAGELASLWRRATALGYAPLLAEIQYVRGVVAATAGEPARAKTVLLEAAHTATSAGYDVLAVESWLYVTVLVGQDLNDYERAREYVGHARAAIDRLGEGPVAQELEVRWQQTNGILLWLEGDYSGAQAQFRSGLELAEQVDPLSIPDLREGLALALESLGRLEAAAAVHVEILAAREAALGTDSPVLMISLANLASALSSTGKHAEALTHIERAVALVLGAYGPEHLDVGRMLTSEAELLRRLGREDEALERVDRARPIIEHAQGAHSIAVSSLDELRALVLVQLGRDDEAVALQRSVLEVYQREDPGGPDHGMALINLAASLSWAGRVPEAVEAAGRGRDLLLKSGPKAVTSSVAKILFGDVLQRSGQSELALTELEPAAATLAKIGYDPAYAAVADFARARAVFAVTQDKARAGVLARSAYRVLRELPAWRRYHRDLVAWAEAHDVALTPP